MHVEWSPLAVAQLTEIREYIALDRPMAASRIASRIVAAIRLLESHPRIGRPGSVSGTRELVISGTPFLAAYSIADEHVTILAVLHGARQRDVPGT